MEDFDDSAGDIEDVSNVDMSDVSDDTGSDDLGDIPETPDDASTDVSDVLEEPEMSISELYEQGQQDMLDAQQEAEDWADENGMTEWSDGTPRMDTEEEFPEIPDEVPQDVPEVVEDTGEIDEQMVDEASESTDDVSEDVPEEASEPSISELYEQGQRDMLDAQQEAEDWADAHDVNAWSDGSMREGHENDEYFRSSLDADQAEKEGLQQQADYYESQGR